MNNHHCNLCTQFCKDCKEQCSEYTRIYHEYVFHCGMADEAKSHTKKHKSALKSIFDEWKSKCKCVENLDYNSYFYCRKCPENTCPSKKCNAVSYYYCHNEKTYGACCRYQIEANFLVEYGKCKVCLNWNRRNVAVAFLHLHQTNKHFAQLPKDVLKFIINKIPRT